LSSELSSSENEAAIKARSKKKPKKVIDDEEDQHSEKSEKKKGSGKQATSGSQISMSRQLVTAMRTREGKEEQKKMN
jgi:hypothetical protein